MIQSRLFLFFLILFLSGIRKSESNINLKKLQQALDYDPSILEKIQNLNLAPAFDHDIKNKLQGKIAVTSYRGDQDSNNNFEINNNDVIDYGQKVKLKKPLKTTKQEIIVGNEFDPEYEKRKRFWKKLNIPEGSSLSMTIQVSRPDIIPGLFNQGDAIVLDGVIELPLWFDIDVYAKHVYEELKPKPPLLLTPAAAAVATAAAGAAAASSGGGERSSKSEGKIAGYERCYLYEQIETATARTMEVSIPTAHACFLRTICEIHALVSFTPDFLNTSVLFELIILFLTPSLGADDDCFAPYLLAERMGRDKSLCYGYSRECPISLASVLLSNFANN